MPSQQPVSRLQVVRLAAVAVAAAASQVCAGVGGSTMDEFEMDQHPKLVSGVG